MYIKKYLFMVFLFNFSLLFSYEETPNDAYENYLHAIKTDNVDEIIKYSIPEFEVTKEEFLAALPTMQKYIPYNIEYRKEIVIDNMALLYTKGDFTNPISKNDEQCIGLVKLYRVEEIWKIRKNIWQCNDSF